MTDYWEEQKEKEEIKKKRDGKQIKLGEEKDEYYSY